MTRGLFAPVEPVGYHDRAIKFSDQRTNAKSPRRTKPGTTTSGGNHGRAGVDSCRRRHRQNAGDHLPHGQSDCQRRAGRSHPCGDLHQQGRRGNAQPGLRLTLARGCAAGATVAFHLSFSVRALAPARSPQRGPAPGFRDLRRRRSAGSREAGHGQAGHRR